MPTTTKTGWRPVQAIDLRRTGDEPGHCQRCNRNDLRFLHVVEHPDEGQLEVGCECAKRICFGYRAEWEERRLRNLWARRSRWLTRNWATSWKGNQTLKFKHKGETVRVTVFLDRFGGWSYCIAIDGTPHYSAERCQTADDAKLGAFDLIAAAAEW